LRPFYEVGETELKMETNCTFLAKPIATVIAAVVRDIVNWTFCVWCVFVHGHIVVYLVLQSVPVVANVTSNYFYPCFTFRHMVYKKRRKNTRGRLDCVILEAAVAFQTLLHVYQTTRCHT
jgi:hypothetical protein